MSNRIILSFTLCLVNWGTMYAQWTEQDTSRIEDVQTGKQKIKLNQETLRAIQSGTLINFDSPKPANQPKPYRSKTYITKDFDLKAVPGIPRETMDALLIPQQAKDSSLNIPPRVFSQLSFNYLPAKEIRAFKVSSKSDNLKATPAGFSFSAEDLLQSIFSKSGRAKRRNLKKANAWKTYNNFP